MKNVLIIMSTNIFSGAEKVLVDYLKNNDAYQFFIYTNDIEMPLLDKMVKRSTNIILIKRKRMRVISIRKYPFYSIAYIIYNLCYIRKIINKYNIDLIYGNNTIDMLYVMLYKYLSKSKIGAICHVHDIIQRAMYHNLIRKFNSLIDAFIVPSKAGRDSFKMDVDYDNKIYVVHNGCNLEEKKESYHTAYQKKSYIKLIFIGQLCKRKRVDFFIDIIKELSIQNPNKYKGIIVGKMVDSDEKYKNEIEKNLYEMKDYIDYKGPVDSKYLYQTKFFHADALILTSDRDPLPTVILEAMALGVPVFSREVDGVSEMIDNGVNGFSWPYDMDAIKVAQYIDERFSYMDNFSMIKDSAKEKIFSEFSNEWKVRRINQIIKTCISNRRVSK